MQPRENHERGFPLATLSFTGKGMLKDRVYGIKETLFHDPYYQRHVVGAPIVRRIVGAEIAGRDIALYTVDGTVYATGNSFRPLACDAPLAA